MPIIKYPAPAGAAPATPLARGTVYGITDQVQESTALGAYTDPGQQAASIGAYASSSPGGVSAGFQASAVGTKSISIGYTPYAAGTSAIAIGDQANTSHDFATAIGIGAQAGYQSVAIGPSTTSSGSDSVVICGNSTGNNNIVISSYQSNAENGLIAIGGNEHTSLKIPGLGIDTTQASNGQTLVWNSTAGNTGSGAFEWQTAGGGGGVPAPPSTPGAVLTSDPYGTGTTTWTKNPRHMAYRLTSPMEFVNYDTVAPTAITLCSEAEHNPELGYFAPGNYAIYLHQLTSMTFTEGGRAALFDGEPYTFMDPLGNSSPTVTYINNTGTTFGFGMGGFNGPSVITGKLSIEMCTLSMGYFLRATQ